MKKTLIIIAMTGILAAMTGCENVSGTRSENTVPTKADVTTTAAASEKTSTTAAKSDNKIAKTSEGSTSEVGISEVSTTAESDENISSSSVTKTDYMQIAGVWYEENVLDSRALTIDGDGTYRLHIAVAEVNTAILRLSVRCLVSMMSQISGTASIKMTVLCGKASVLQNVKICLLHWFQDLTVTHLYLD